MRFLRQLLSEASSLFFLGVGISGMRRIERDLRLSELPCDSTWKRKDIQADLTDHRGEPAVLLKCEGEPGLSWVDGLQFAEGEISIDWAASRGAFGIAVDVRDKDDYRMIRFSSQDSGATVWNVGFYSSREVEAGPTTMPVEELNGVSLDWVKVRIIIHKGRIVVIVNDNNIPCLRVDDYHPELPGGSIGIWLDRGTSCLFTNLKCVEIRKQIKI